MARFSALDGNVLLKLVEPGYLWRFIRTDSIVGNVILLVFFLVLKVLTIDTLEKEEDE